MTHIKEIIKARCILSNPIDVFINGKKISVYLSKLSFHNVLFLADVLQTPCDKCYVMYSRDSSELLYSLTEKERVYVTNNMEFTISIERRDV